MDHLDAIIEACSRAGGDAAPDQTVTASYEDISRANTPVTNDVSSPLDFNNFVNVIDCGFFDNLPAAEGELRQRPDNILDNSTRADVTQLVTTGVPNPPIQHASGVRQNIPVFLSGDPVWTADFFAGQGNGSSDVCQSSSVDCTGPNSRRIAGDLSPPVAVPADAGQAAAVNGSMERPTSLRNQRSKLVLKATSGEERERLKKDRNIFHANESRRRRKEKRAKLEKETELLEIDIRQLKTDIRTICAEIGLGLDFFFNHRCPGSDVTDYRK